MCMCFEVNIQNEMESFQNDGNMSLSCRFYANEFPAVGDTVVAKVNKIDESGAYVTLSEYNNKGILSAEYP